MLCAAAPQLALAAFVLELAIYHNEILDNADRFKQLLRYDTPEAMAQLTTLCGELLVFHKGLQAARGGGQLALQRYAKTLENLSSGKREGLK